MRIFFWQNYIFGQLSHDENMGIRVERFLRKNENYFWATFLVDFLTMRVGESVWRGFRFFKRFRLRE